MSFLDRFSDGHDADRERVLMNRTIRRRDMVVADAMGFVPEDCVDLLDTRDGIRFPLKRVKVPHTASDGRITEIEVLPIVELEAIESRGDGRKTDFSGLVLLGRQSNDEADREIASITMSSRTRVPTLFLDTNRRVSWRSADAEDFLTFADAALAAQSDEA